MDLLRSQTPTLLPIFLTTTLLLGITMLTVSILALHRPHTFAQNFGLPLPSSPTINAPKTPNTNQHPPANPQAWIIPLAAREMALALSLLALLYVGEYRALSVLVLALGVVGVGDGVATAWYGRVGSVGQHAGPGVVVVGAGALGWVLCGRGG